MIFLAIGCSATKWNSDRSDLIKPSKAELFEKITWARKQFQLSGIDTSNFSDAINLGSRLPYPKLYERATVLCKAISVTELPEIDILNSIITGLGFLRSIYEWTTSLSDLKTSEIAEFEVKTVVNPIGYIGQGYGLSAPERRAVELHAMKVVREFLVSKSYEVTDKSLKNSFDYLAERGTEKVKVEVKGTTSTIADAVLMTANEVDLHKSEAGTTALAIVSGIKFKSRGELAACEGGSLEFIYPWDIDEWTTEPKAFIVRRTLKEDEAK